MKKFKKPTTKNEIAMWQAACESILIIGIISMLLGLSVGFSIGIGRI